jgi:hypothetical protein
MPAMQGVFCFLRKKSDLIFLQKQKKGTQARASPPSADGCARRCDLL